MAGVDVFAIGQFSIPLGSTAAITPALTWTDGGSHTPQALFLKGRSGTNGSTNTGNIKWSNGLSDGTTLFCAAGLSADNGVVSAAGSRLTDNGIICETDTSGTEVGLLAGPTFSADQFSVTPSNAFAADWDVEYIAVYNATSVPVVHAAQLNGATGTDPKTGLGNLVGCAGLFIMGRNQTMDTGGALDMFSLGFVDSAGAMGGLFRRHKDGATTDYALGACSSAEIMARLGNTVDGAHNDSVAFTSWDSDGYTLNRLLGTTAYHYAVLILKGGKSKVTSVAAQSGTGTFTAPAATGITPKLVIGLSDSTNTATQSVAKEGVQATVGAHTAAAQWCQTLYSYDVGTVAVPDNTDEYSRGVTDKFMIHWTRSAQNTLGATGEITRSSFAAELVTLDQVDGDPTAIFIPLLILGDSYSAAAAGSKTGGTRLKSLVHGGLT